MMQKDHLTTGMKKLGAAALTLGMLVGSGCSFIVRDADQYRSVTRELISTKSDAITACHTEALKANPDVHGTVIVNFTVIKKTGVISNPQLDPTSTAPAEMGNCVVAAIDGLTLDEPDRKDGQATFVWELKPQQSAQ